MEKSIGIIMKSFPVHLQWRLELMSARV